MNRWPGWAHDSPGGSSTIAVRSVSEGNAHQTHTAGRRYAKKKKFTSRLHFLAYIYIHLSQYLRLPRLGKSERKPVEATGSTGPAPAPVETDAKGWMNSTVTGLFLSKDFPFPLSWRDNNPTQLPTFQLDIFLHPVCLPTPFLCIPYYNYTKK